MRPAVNLPTQVRKPSEVAARANIDTGFKFLELAQPVLILAMIDALKTVSVPVDQQPATTHLGTLAHAATGKRAISDEGMAFAEACDPISILNLCQLFGTTT
jgi:hypothetical protein